MKLLKRPFSAIHGLQSFEALSEQIRIVEQEILRESDDEVDNAKTRDALELIRSKILARKTPRKCFWRDDEALLLLKYW